MSEAFRARLRRLRRDAGPAAAPPPAPTPPDRAGMPDWLRTRLARTRSTAPERDAAPPALAAGEASLGPPRALVEHRGEAGAFAVREERFARDHVHGALPLGAIAAVQRDVLALVARDPVLAALDPTDAVYLDIETTGLAGGSGTIPFLVALGRFDASGDFVLWQGFLRGPHEERALLAEVARRVADASGVVSFFGKSFDRHRLEDKMRVHGVEPPFARRPHLDLYHACARLYRAALRDGRLATMEHALCAVRRRGDLPGSFAPAAWLDFLGRRPHRLESVFRHNRDDVLSLVTIAAHLGCALDERGPDGAALGGPSASRAHALARLFRERGERESELLWLDRAIERTLALAPGADARALRLERAGALCRAGEHERALESYLALADGERDAHAARAWVEIAKLREHRTRDIDAALDACGRAARLVEQTTVGRERERLSNDLARRAERLRAKLARRATR